jgi:hypothetical protein
MDVAKSRKIKDFEIAEEYIVYKKTHEHHCM